jgi:hypothetical protein
MTAMTYTPSSPRDRRQARRNGRRPKKPRRRQALELLSGCPDGCAEGILLANGFTADLLVELIRLRLVSAHAERMVTDGKVTQAARLGITDEGRRALASDTSNQRVEPA